MEEISHPHACWESLVDCVVPMFVDLGDEEGLENIPCRKIEEGLFGVCCCPFFVYDLSIGDEFMIRDGESVTVRKHSALVRISFAESSVSPQRTFELVDGMEKVGVESYGRMVSVAIKELEDLRVFQERLSRLYHENPGLAIEIGSTGAFSVDDFDLIVGLTG